MRKGITQFIDPSIFFFYIPTTLMHNEFKDHFQANQVESRVVGDKSIRQIQIFWNSKAGFTWAKFQGRRRGISYSVLSGNSQISNHSFSGLRRWAHRLRQGETNPHQTTLRNTILNCSMLLSMLQISETGYFQPLPSDCLYKKRNRLQLN